VHFERESFDRRDIRTFLAKKSQNAVTLGSQNLAKHHISDIVVDAAVMAFIALAFESLQAHEFYSIRELNIDSNLEFHFCLLVSQEIGWPTSYFV
jgi:hypothetical protein